MKVRCINIDPEQFPIDPPFKDAFWHSPGLSFASNTFSSVDVGRSYVVYAITQYAGFPFYYVSGQRPYDDWTFAPSLCFEILDNRLSKLWHIGMNTRRKTPVATLAIREWVEEPDFYARLVDCHARELGIMRSAAASMDAEYA